MLWIKIAALVVASVLTSVLTNAVFRKWPKTGKWAITSGTASCPVCRETPRPVRVPTDIHEMLWGGNTCVRCGTKFDKHGKERVN